ncbi:MAG: 4-hydroxy-3-methylbut-2-enyl diphosphate reductase [Kiritimatiellia bacterium]
MKKIIIVEPHGFCSGVARAVRTAEKILEIHAGQTVYCLNQIVHNQQVVGDLRARGMVFVERVENVPEGSLLLLSAHGVSPQVKTCAAERNLKVVDAVCPFVSKVHAEVRAFSEQGVNVICIGHRSHEEVAGVAGEAPDAVHVVENVMDVEALDLPVDKPVGVVTQTTLGAAQVDAVMDALKSRFSQLQLPESTDVCYATRNRQNAVRTLAGCTQRVLVLGSPNSSNSLRLVECAAAEGVESLLISSAEDVDKLDWQDIRCAGLTSGASTPENFLNAVVDRLRNVHGFDTSETLTAVAEQSRHFKMPL